MAPEPQRLDVTLYQNFPQYSRTYFQKLIEDGCIQVNGKLILRPSSSVALNASIQVQFPVPPSPVLRLQETSSLDVQVVFEHEHFLVINKPAGLTVHSPGAKSTEITLVDWLISYCHEIAGVGVAERPGIVHRLDKDTSGLMLVARNNYSHKVFGDMFKGRLMSKQYSAIVTGHPQKSGTIDYKIMRHPNNRIKMMHHPERGKHSLTHFTVEQYFDGHALVNAFPVTGRTHQIRVHLSALGHKLIGDTLYGKPSSLIGRQALHAAALAFTFEGKEYSFTQQPPEDFKRLIAALQSEK